MAEHLLYTLWQGDDGKSSHRVICNTQSIVHRNHGAMTFLFVLAPLPMEVYSFLRNSLTFITTPCLTLSNSLFQDTRTPLVMPTKPSHQLVAKEQPFCFDFSI